MIYYHKKFVLITTKIIFGLPYLHYTKTMFEENICYWATFDNNMLNMMVLKLGRFALMMDFWFLNQQDFYHLPPVSRSHLWTRKLTKLQSWTKLLRQNRKSIFQWKTPLPPNQCCWQSFRLLITKIGQIQHWYWGRGRVRGRIWNLKN